MQLQPEVEMAAGFLVLLFLAWVALCLRAAARARDTGVVATTDSFRRGLELLGSDRHPEFVRTYGRLAPVAPVTDPSASIGSRSTDAPEVGPRSTDATDAGPRSTDALETRPRHSFPLGRSAAAPPPHSPAGNRRDVKPLRVRLAPLVVLGFLVAGALVTLGLFLWGGSWELHLTFDAALALFVSWLFEDQHRRAERRRKVTALPARRSQPGDLRLAAGDR